MRDVMYNLQGTDDSAPRYEALNPMHPSELEELERLRKEQNPGKYNPTRPQPQPYAPGQCPYERPPGPDQEEREDPNRGVWEIELWR